MRNRRFSRILPVVVIGMGLSACESSLQESFANLDLDLRGEAGGLDTSDAARQATQPRPSPDAQGILSYPNYQVAVAQRGDTLTDVATRIGYDPSELARYNGRATTDRLNEGEVIALPRKIATAPTNGSASLDITQIATSAIDRAGPSTAAQVTTKRIDGPEPIRHRVARGETAYTIARLYNVSPRSLNDWNGLGPDLAVREGQFLLIPVVEVDETPKPVRTAAISPGAGTPTPQPPSAKKPLPEPVTPVAAPAAQASKPAASSFIQPVSGSVLRAYRKGKNDGIDIAAATGTSVKASADGEVAAITRDTDQKAILVLRHSKNVLTVYANISDISVKKGDKVRQGQSVAKVGSGSPSFLHFEVREGFESVNPSKYLK